MTQPRYRLTGRLESGELAELFEATREDGQKVVVKLFHPRTSDLRYARILAETTRRLSSLDGEAVVRVLDLGIVRGRLAIVREHVDGFTLGQALQRLMTREVLMAPALALYVILQLLEGVQRGHDLGVIHGAITPGNVLLGKDGRTGLADFGALAALVAVPELRAFASRGRGAYRALEISQGEPPTPASDVYSLGAIAYELLTLREAVRSARAVSTRHEPLPPPSRLDRRINARLDPIIMRALEPSPQRRFKSCSEMANALRNFLSVSGGMPGRADLAKLLGELFPNEVQLQASPQVPFTEEFTLSEVSGAELPAAPAVGHSEVLALRPSFSGGAIPAVVEGDRSEAETIEEVPAFEPHAVHRPKNEPSFGGTTSREAASLERGWEAPPGAVATKRPPGAKAMAMSGMSAALKGRVRVVEDFGGLDHPEPEDADRDAPPSEGTATRARAQKVAPSPTIESTQVDAPVLEPAPGSLLAPEPDGERRRMFTEERELWMGEVMRRRFLVIAVAVTVVGVLCFVLVVWRASTPESSAAALETRADGSDGGPPPAPSRVDAIEQERLVDRRRADPEADSRAVVSAPEPKTSVRSTRANIAYLSVTTNVPAAVFVDGHKLAKTTPLRRYKVEAGRRTVMLQSLRTQERREFSVSFEPGKEMKFFQRFDTPGR